MIPMPNPERSRLPVLLVFVDAALVLAAGCARAPSPEGPSVEVVPLAPPFVELVRLNGPSPLGGDMAEGTAGDWLLRNERLAVVIGAATGLDGARAGRILDAAPTSGEDVLREVRVAASAAPLADPMATYLSVVSRPDRRRRDSASWSPAVMSGNFPRSPSRPGTRSKRDRRSFRSSTRFVNGGLRHRRPSRGGHDPVGRGGAVRARPGVRVRPKPAIRPVPHRGRSRHRLRVVEPAGAIDVSGGPTWSHALSTTTSLPPGARFASNAASPCGMAAPRMRPSRCGARWGTAVGLVTVDAHRDGEQWRM